MHAVGRSSSLYLPKEYDMQMYVEVEVNLHAFLTQTLGGG
jgi:hypothetical protein